MSPREKPLLVKQCRKFVFVGHVRSEKGILVIKEALIKLQNSDVSVDIYGSLNFDVNISQLSNIDNLNYRGLVDSQSIVSVLKNYHALLLPSWWPEGYPGVIIEAYSAGIPVIVTDVGGIPEIVDSSTGLFVKPKDVNSLTTAMNCLIKSDSTYRELLMGVHNRRLKFSSSYWTERYIECCNEILSENAE